MNKSLQAAWLAVLLALAAASGAMIKVGDVLEIVVPNHPEFSGRFTVAENGAIDYPLLADEPVANITTSELMNHLTFRLAKHIDNPLVLVSVVLQPEITVVMLGQVMKPGPVKTYQGATLQEALIVAGGPTPAADLSRIKIVPHNTAEVNARFFDLREFLDKGSMAGLPKMEAGDTIVLLTQERTTKIKVIGGVARPGFFDLEGKVNVFEAIYMAGGPAEKADLSRVRRLTQQDGRSTDEVINVQGYIDRGRMDELPLVAPGDVIIVYTRWFDWQTLLTILNNTLLFIVTLQALGGVFAK